MMIVDVGYKSCYIHYLNEMTLPKYYMHNYVPGDSESQWLTLYFSNWFFNVGLGSDLSNKSWDSSNNNSQSERQEFYKVYSLHKNSLFKTIFSSNLHSCTQLSKVTASQQSFLVKTQHCQCHSENHFWPFIEQAVPDA